MPNNGKGFRKGDPRHPNAGRKKGSRNLRTEQWETFSEYCMSSGLIRFKQEFEKLEGLQYISAFTNMLEYFKPKLARQEITGKDGETPTTKIIIELKKWTP